MTRFQITEAHAEAAANWCAKQWIPDDTRDAFRAAVRETLLEPDVGTGRDWYSNGRLLLACDYDPQGPLLSAVKKVVPDCRGFLFSAKGLLYGKTYTWLAHDEIEACAGRGEPDEVIWRAK